jgi:phosphoglycerol transferase MdoB-like AlkP superfamily enzyme
MAAAQVTHEHSTAMDRLTTGAAIMALAGIGFVGYGVIFFIRDFTNSFLELGIGPEQVDVGKDQIEQFSPQLLHYISHLHIAISGFIGAAGIAVAGLAWYGVRRGELWAWVTAVVVPVFGLAVALPAHYPWGFDTLGHLGLIYLDTAIFVVGAVIALLGLMDQRARTP